MTKQEMFERYEQVRKSGKYNMVIDAINAMRTAGLTPDEYFTVLHNYDEFKTKYEAKTIIKEALKQDAPF